METLIGSLHGVALAAGFWGILFVAFVQEVIPPLPSSAISMSLGFLLFAGETLNANTVWLLFLKIGLPIALGLTAGAVIIYYIVRWGGMAIIDRWGKWIGVTREDIDTLQARMKGTRTDDAILFAARAFPLVPSIAVNIVAGLTRWNIWSFILLTFFGTIIRAMWSAAIGWQVGTAFSTYAETIEQIQAWVLVGLVVAAAGFILYRRHRQKGIMNDITS